MMNELFSGLITRGVVIVYMDDILIFTKTLEEHRAVTKEVLRILADNNLSLKPEKCEWRRRQQCDGKRRRIELTVRCSW